LILEAAYRRTSASLEAIQLPNRLQNVSLRIVKGLVGIFQTDFESANHILKLSFFLKARILNSLSLFQFFKQLVLAQDLARGRVRPLARSDNFLVLGDDPMRVSQLIITLKLVLCQDK
jgi:hypothetical protein